jgi:hypothetical protein
MYMYVYICIAQMLVWSHQFGDSDRRSRAFFSLLLLSSLELSDTTVYEPEIRALLGTALDVCEVAVPPSSNAGSLSPIRAAQAFFRCKVNGCVPRAQHVNSCTVRWTVTVGRRPRQSIWRLRNRGTSLIRNRPPLGPYRRPVPRVLGGS